MTGEPILATSIDANFQRHIVRCERIREDDGAATSHRHDGKTLCGQGVETLLPFLPVKMATACPECVCVYHDGKGKPKPAAKVVERFDTPFGRVSRYLVELWGK